MGAHVGAFSFAALRRGAGHVFAVEPLGVNAQLLQANLADWADKVTIVEVAAWSHETELVLGEDSCHVPGNTSTCTAFRGTDAGRAIQAVPLDRLIVQAAQASSTQTVKLFKIDADGAEYPALLNSTKLNHVEVIVGEIHRNVDWQGRVCGPEDIAGRLESVGFRFRAKENGPNTVLFHATNGAVEGCAQAGDVHAFEEATK